MTKFCPECGTEQHDENNRYCHNCGFDFSKLENGTFDFSSSDNSSINIPISSDSEGSVGSKPSVSASDNDDVSKKVGSASDNDDVSKPVSSINKNSPSSTIQKNSSSTNKTKTNIKSAPRTKMNNNSNGFLSNLSFNKCFLAFALLLIILVILGMLTEVTQEPYSDNGLTSFMESSDSYDLNDFLEDYGYDNDYSDYDDDSSNIFGTII